MKIINLLGYFLVSSVLSCGSNGQHPPTLREAWNAANDPLLLGGQFDRTFGGLPLNGQLDLRPWTDSYWPSYMGGISQRWRATLSADEQFTYTPPTRDQVAAMNLADLADLSPAEKYDILMDRFDYPTVKRERERVSPTNATWEGMCHGWAAASLNFKEPRSLAARSPSGINVPFASSDVKALLSYYQGDIAYAPSRLLGLRCDVDLVKNPSAIRYHPECRGINAGALHVALTNLVGRRKVGFVAEVARGYEVWNQPVYAFSGVILREQAPSPKAAEGTMRELVVSMKMSYAIEVEPQWNALNDSDYWYGIAARYEYTLELDGRGKIIGGAWLSTDRPDFIWTQEPPVFAGYYQRLGELYQLSLNGAPLPDPRVAALL
ncbi:MAG: hypothetical protein FJ146_00635 [Deltaproteobacteria bacterium]|nr:hypothetical protein [Deltaproteobacteria bacterium]